MQRKVAQLLYLTGVKYIMSINKLKLAFENASKHDDWSIQLLRIYTTKRNGTKYTAREIRLEPADRMLQFIKELSNIYINRENGKLLSFSETLPYDGTALGTVIYKLPADNMLIKDEYRDLISAIASPNHEINPLDFSSQAYLLKGQVIINDTEYSVKLISMKNPITQLKHRFTYGNSSFKAVSDKVLYLRQSIDVIILGNCVYMLTLAGEKLFNMERAYKSICEKKIYEIKTCNILSDYETFSHVARTGYNPRRFVSFNEHKLDQLKNDNIRIDIATKFNIPLVDGKFDTTQECVAEKIVKILCDKGMIDPIKNTPVEVSNAKPWT